MSYIVTVVTTRPSGVYWFSKDNSSESANIKIWQSNQKELVSITGEFMDPGTNNVFKTVLTFNSEADYITYSNAANSNPDIQARKTYNDTNSITSVTTVG
jgi:hypothetical protein